MEEIAIKENSLQELQKLSLEAMMRAEREEHNATNGDMSNGYRPRRTLGRGKIIEHRVPRSRNGQFYPILLSALRDQEEECRKLAFKLYGTGLIADTTVKDFLIELQLQFQTTSATITDVQKNVSL